MKTATRDMKTATIANTIDIYPAYMRLRLRGHEVEGGVHFDCVIASILRPCVRTPHSALPYGTMNAIVLLWMDGIDDCVTAIACRVGLAYFKVDFSHVSISLSRRNLLIVAARLIPNGK